jgi:hypothetical protein
VRKNSLQVLLAMALSVGVSYLSAVAAGNWQPDDKVEVEENGTWYPSTVLKAGDGKWFIHYDGYDPKYDLWVGPDRVRAISGPKASGDLKVGDSVKVWHNGNGQFAWMPGVIKDIKDGKFQIWYGGSRYNLWWFEAKAIQGTQEQIAATEEAKIDPFMRQAFERFEAAVAEVEALQKTSPKPADLRKAIDNANQAMTADYARALRHPKVKPVQERYWAFATKEVDFLLADAMTTTQQAEAKGDINFARSHDYVLKRAQEVVDAYKAFRPEGDAETQRLDAAMATAKQKLDAAGARIQVAYVASAKVPSETYGGADKAKLKALVTAAWKKKNPNLPILKVVATSPWKRDRYWNTSSGRAYWHDHSSILLDIVAKKDATTATVYPVGVTYDNGDPRTMEAYAGTSGFGNYVPFDVLLKNVK